MGNVFLSEILLGMGLISIVVKAIIDSLELEFEVEEENLNRDIKSRSDHV